MRKIVCWIPSILWMGIIFYSSSTPYEEQNVQPLLGEYLNLQWLAPYLEGISFTYDQNMVSIATHGVEGFIEFFIRKGAHVGVFLVLTLLLYLGLAQHKMKHPMLAAWLLTVFYAITDELHQGITPNRTPYIGDVILDAIGGLAGLSLIYFIRKRSRKKSMEFK
ncbi:VanZ family protein [Halobacillus sp. A1]|uniref:VanZ family protein n=1 Tax=Halobacillus sp. A1 TaxID=2880262 RepID=UPI0020A62254|nr:VanZ family protein [Halobacillus sp. A1]MCP3031472.1 VanZ family protein [Halobacillus sp. A1]